MMRDLSREKTAAIPYRLYLRLLVICQPEFRMQYGYEMAQVFREYCLEAKRRDGWAGLVRWWGEAILDLAGTAIVTRGEILKQGEMEMKRLFRIVGQGAFGGFGILLLLYAVIKRPMSYWNLGVLFCVVIMSLSVSLVLSRPARSWVDSNTKAEEKILSLNGD